MSELIDNISSSAEAMTKKLVTLRRDLHMHPELRFGEKRTADIVAKRMEKLGLNVRTGVGETGVVAVLRGAKRGKCVALRADMDAIGIQDHKEVNYKSTVPKVTHACGHDAHVTVACGVAEVLAKMQKSIPGMVVFLFQPGEEIGLEGRSGAAAMIEAGALKRPSPEAVFGFHCWPGFKAGTVGVAEGPAMAGADSITFHVYGEGAHAGTPHLGRDAILAMSQCIVSLYHIIPRNLPPSENTTLHFGIVRGGISRAILADRVTAIGTLRTLNRQTRSLMKQRIGETISNICSAYDLGSEIKWTLGIPPVINNKDLTRLVRQASHDVLGKRRTIEVAHCPMTAEDFTLFIQDRPGFHLKLGVADAKTGRCHPLHHNRFDIDEKALPTGVKVLSLALLRYLGAE
ncbi:MAG: amidohydrolase [Planctomycetes bacterium]|nr:amidohydrolase [Planctomycetota bacterium]